MTLFFIIIHVIVCLVLILVILLQAGRGQGLAGPSFASGNVQSLFGTRASDFLTKATSVSAILFLFTCIGLDIIETHRSHSLFAANRKATPVEVQQIQKVLEKIKADEAKKVAAKPAAQKTTPEKSPVPVTTPAPEPKKG